MNRRFELTNQEWERLGRWGRCCPLVSCPCREQAPDAFRAELERIGVEGAVDCSRLTISDQLLRRLLAAAPQKDDRPPEFDLAVVLAPLNLASCSKRLAEVGINEKVGFAEASPPGDLHRDGVGRQCPGMDPG